MVTSASHYIKARSERMTSSMKWIAIVVLRSANVYLYLTMFTPIRCNASSSVRQDSHALAAPIADMFEAHTIVLARV